MPPNTITTTPNATEEEIMEEQEEEEASWRASGGRGQGGGQHHLESSNTPPAASMSPKEVMIEVGKCAQLFYSLEKKQHLFARFLLRTATQKGGVGGLDRATACVCACACVCVNITPLRFSPLRITPLITSPNLCRLNEKTKPCFQTSRFFWFLFVCRSLHRVEHRQHVVRLGGRW